MSSILEKSIQRQEFTAPGTNPPISHYTDGVSFGDLLFISGMAPLDDTGKLVGGDDVAEQARKVLQNMQSVLELAGGSFANVLRVTVYLTNVDDRKLINPVRQEFFGDHRPASTLFEVSKLAIPGMKVEIEAVAGIPGLGK